MVLPLSVARPTMVSFRLHYPIISDRLEEANKKLNLSILMVQTK